MMPVRPLLENGKIAGFGYGAKAYKIKTQEAKPSDVVPPPESPAEQQRAHPDQLFPDIEGPYPDMSPAGEEPHISEWLDCGEMFVCFIDGPLIKNNLHIDFTEGGHFLKWAFIPENQIWIEDTLHHIDQCATVIHEAHEHFLMSQGMSYDEAHASASKTERIFRNMTIAEGTILPSDSVMATLVALELQGESCLDLAKEKIEENESAVAEWAKSTGEGK